MYIMIERRNSLLIIGSTLVVKRMRFLLRSCILPYTKTKTIRK